MILGMSVSTFTAVHVVTSLIGIASGLIVASGWLTRKRLDGWTTLFLATTAATSVTGFFFPVHKLMPSHIVGTLSLIVLALAIYALYGRRLSGRWRAAYVISANVALYFNVFVAVVQAFAKSPTLKALAPTQSEPPIAVAQLVVLVLFVALGAKATKAFREEPVPVTEREAVGLPG